jgi:hypothetical protein
MGKGKKYIKKSADGRFFWHIENPRFDPIDIDKKTKLWLSSDYLFSERVKENPTDAYNELKNLIDLNKEKENYEECSSLIDLRDRYFVF